MFISTRLMKLYIYKMGLDEGGGGGLTCSSLSKAKRSCSEPTVFVRIPMREEQNMCKLNI